MLLRYLKSYILFLVTDSISRGMLGIRFSQYSREISKTQKCSIASFHSGTEVGCLLQVYL